MCTTSKDNSKLDFIHPPEDSQPGDQVLFEGVEGEPDAILNPKKKIYEKLSVDFNVQDDLVVRWKNIPFSTKNGTVKASEGFAGSIVS